MLRAVVRLPRRPRVELPKVESKGLAPLVGNDWDLAPLDLGTSQAEVLAARAAALAAQAAEEKARAQAQALQEARNHLALRLTQAISPATQVDAKLLMEAKRAQVAPPSLHSRRAVRNLATIADDLKEIPTDLSGEEKERRVRAQSHARQICATLQDEKGAGIPTLIKIVTVQKLVGQNRLPLNDISLYLTKDGPGRSVYEATLQDCREAGELDVTRLQPSDFLFLPFAKCDQEFPDENEFLDTCLAGAHCVSSFFSPQTPLMDWCQTAKFQTLLAIALIPKAFWNAYIRESSSDPEIQNMLLAEVSNLKAKTLKLVQDLYKKEDYFATQMHLYNTSETGDIAVIFQNLQCDSAALGLEWETRQLQRHIKRTLPVFVSEAADFKEALERNTRGHEGIQAILNAKATAITATPMRMSAPISLRHALVQRNLPLTTVLPTSVSLPAPKPKTEWYPLTSRSGVRQRRSSGGSSELPMPPTELMVSSSSSQGDSKSSHTMSRRMGGSASTPALRVRPGTPSPALMEGPLHGSHPSSGLRAFPLPHSGSKPPRRTLQDTMVEQRQILASLTSTSSAATSSTSMPSSSSDTKRVLPSTPVQAPGLRRDLDEPSAGPMSGDAARRRPPITMHRGAFTEPPLSSGTSFSLELGEDLISSTPINMGHRAPGIRASSPSTVIPAKPRQRGALGASSRTTMSTRGGEDNVERIMSPSEVAIPEEETRYTALRFLLSQRLGQPRDGQPAPEGIRERRRPITAHSSARSSSISDAVVMGAGTLVGTEDLETSFSLSHDNLSPSRPPSRGSRSLSIHSRPPTPARHDRLREDVPGMQAQIFNDLMTNPLTPVTGISSSSSVVPPTRAPVRVVTPSVSGEEPGSSSLHARPNTLVRQAMRARQQTIQHRDLTPSLAPSLQPVVGLYRSGSGEATSSATAIMTGEEVRPLDWRQRTQSSFHSSSTSTMLGARRPSVAPTGLVTLSDPEPIHRGSHAPS